VDVRLPPIEARRRGIIVAVQSGANILRGGGSALDAVVVIVVAVENNPHFNAGFGSVLTVEGRVEMDAALMTAPGPRAHQLSPKTSFKGWE
jgi:beta-aspartyl-peptidase (threonine type)